MRWAKFVQVLINEFQADQFQCPDPCDLKKFTYNKTPEWLLTRRPQGLRLKFHVDTFKMYSI